MKGAADGPQAEIADHLQVAQSSVSSDLKRIRAEWRSSTIRDFDMLQTVELKNIERIEREAWTDGERSQKPLQQARIKGGSSEQNAERLVKNQTGDPRFLEQVHKCVTARRAILGLDAPTRIEPVGQIDTAAYAAGRARRGMGRTLVLDGIVFRQPLGVDLISCRPRRLWG